jgi:hypothetical protein
MSGTAEHLAARLEAEGQKTVEFFRNLAAPDWEREVYADGAVWRVRQVLAHFVASEISMCRLVEDVLRGGPGSPEDFRLNEYNQRRVAKLEEFLPDELIEHYTQARRETIELVQGLAPADLEKTGRHPFLGIASLEEIIKLMYRHNQIHQRDIRSAISAAGVG